MKEPINLLPRAAKIGRIHALYAQRVQTLLNWVIALLVVLAVLLGSVYAGLALLQRHVHNTLAVKDPSANVAETQIAATNTLLAAFAKTIQASTPWTDKIKDLLQTLPDGMQLSSLTVPTNTTAPSLVITAIGITDDPTKVVSWRKQIEQLPWVTSVTAPLDNFATTQHGSFTLTIQVAPSHSTR